MCVNNAVKRHDFRIKKHSTDSYELEQLCLTLNITVATRQTNHKTNWNIITKGFRKKKVNIKERI